MAGFRMRAAQPPRYKLQSDLTELGRLRYAWSGTIESLARLARQSVIDLRIGVPQYNGIAAR